MRFSIRFAADDPEINEINPLLFALQGKLYVRGDSKIFRFQNGKSESLFLQRKNPRRIAWTTLYRRQHRKGISEVSEPFPHLFSWEGLGGGEVLSGLSGLQNLER